MENKRYLSYNRIVSARTKEKTVTLLIASAIIIAIAGALFLNSGLK